LNSSIFPYDPFVLRESISSKWVEVVSKYAPEEKLELEDAPSHPLPFPRLGKLPDSTFNQPSKIVEFPGTVQPSTVLVFPDEETTFGPEY
jgi:hypothetical protein